MKIERIQLGGKEYRVRESAKPMRNRDGYCHPSKGEIVLSKGMSPHERKLMFVHEAFHALFWYLDESVVDLAARELVEALDRLDLD